MIGFNHALSGALVAVLTPTEYLVYVPIVAFIVHFILDVFPHYGRDDTAPVHSKKFNRILMLDAVLSMVFVAIACLLYPDKLLWIGLGAFFAMLPDFLWIFHYYIKVNWKPAKIFFRFAQVIQWGERPWGWSLEILYAMIMLAVLVSFS